MVNERSVDGLWRQAQVRMGAGDTTAARGVLESLLQQCPTHASAHMTLSHIAWAEDRVREAAWHALETARHLPTEPISIVATSMALLRVGETVAARACLEHPALARTRNGSVLMYQAGVRRELGEDTEALQLMDRAHALGVDGAEFYFARGLERVICGFAAEAAADFETSLRMDPATCVATLELARLRTQNSEHNHLEDFDRRRSLVAKGTLDHAALEFARYAELEDIGRYDEAWEALASANAVMQIIYPYTPERTRKQVNAIISGHEWQASKSKLSALAGPQPIFIVGLPRSGTTLLDRLLGSHSCVISAGELEDFSRQLCWASDQRTLLGDQMLQRLPDLDYEEIGRRYLAQTQWRAGEAEFFIDKQPWNYMVAGLVSRALPKARLLHVLRDPMDLCFSNFRAMLGARYAYSSSLNALPQHLLEYSRLMAHWHAMMPGKILNVPYRALVTDTEVTMRRVLAYCGLDWEADCLDPSRNKTPIGTLSATQARGPVHTDAFGIWRPYQRQLATLKKDILSKVQR